MAGPAYHVWDRVLSGAGGTKPRRVLADTNRHFGNRIVAVVSARCPVLLLDPGVRAIRRGAARGRLVEGHAQWLSRYPQVLQHVDP